MRLLTFLTVALFAGGCGSGRVYVIDPQGMPIQGAQVAPVSLSINGAAATTNAQGEATVPLNIGQDTKWVSVCKTGFQSRQVNLPTQWPLNVVLQPATRP